MAYNTPMLSSFCLFYSLTFSFVLYSIHYSTYSPFPYLFSSFFFGGEGSLSLTSIESSRNKFVFHIERRSKKRENMATSGSFFRQLRYTGNWNSTPKRWSNKNKFCGGGPERSLNQMETLNICGGGGCENGGLVTSKRVMVVVDKSARSKHVMMWALTHVTNKGDLLTLLHIIPPTHKGPERVSDTSSPYFANSLESLCKACKPEVEVEGLVIQGPKRATVMSQVKKLEVSVLVLGQKKPSPLLNCLCGSSWEEDFVEQCINNAECLTFGVRKQSRGMGGYLISTKWQKNFWLLA